MRIEDPERAQWLHEQAVMTEAVLREARLKGVSGLELEILEKLTQEAKEADVEYMLENLLDEDGDRVYACVVIDGVKHYKLVEELTAEDRVRMFESWTA